MIRCVGDPIERFSEDALRMLRALRFSAQLGFAIEEDTAKAIRRLCGNIRKVSAERIRTELEKLLLSAHPERLILASEWGLAGIFLPEWDAMLATPQNTIHHYTDVGRHTLAVIRALPADRVLRLAGLLHDVAKPVVRKTDAKGIDHFVGHPFAGEDMAARILRRLKYDNATIRRVRTLVLFHDERPRPGARNARRLAARVGVAALEDLVALKRADLEGQSDYHRREKLERLEELERYFHQFMEDGDALSLPQLRISGKRLIELGVPSGPPVGEMLAALLAEVVDDPARNEAEYLEQRVCRLLGKAK